MKITCKFYPHMRIFSCDSRKIMFRCIYFTKATGAGMKCFEYTVRDEHGIHARPAGILVNAAKTLDCTVTLKLGDKTANAKKLFAVMGLGAEKGDRLIFTADGSDEDRAEAALTGAMHDAGL